MLFLFSSLSYGEKEKSHHNGQEGHAIHLILVDVVAGDVQDGRAEVNICHQHLTTEWIHLVQVNKHYRGHTTEAEWMFCLSLHTSKGETNRTFFFLTDTGLFSDFFTNLTEILSTWWMCTSSVTLSDFVIFMFFECPSYTLFKSIW